MTGESAHPPLSTVDFSQQRHCKGQHAVAAVALPAVALAAVSVVAVLLSGG